MVKILGKIAQYRKKKMTAAKDKKKKYKIYFHLVAGQKQTPVEIEAEGINESEAFEAARKSAEIKFRKEIEEQAAIITYTGKFSIIKNKE